jgi:hypothetical protein
MRICRWSSMVVFALAVVSAGAVRGNEPPADAKKLIEDYDKEIGAIQKKAEEEIRTAEAAIQKKALEEMAVRQAKTVAALQAVQDALTKDGKLDEALAVRERIREVKAGPLLVAKQVEVLWGATWFPSEILQVKDGKYFIRYNGWSDSSNEWVTKDRIRPVQNKNPSPEKK